MRKQELATLAAGWPSDAPIIDAILPHKITGAFDEITAALSAVGLGSVPGWLRPFHLLSNGEQFRAALARLLLEPPAAVSVVDEFTSVVDRVVAKIGAAAFAKAWRRKHPGQQFVALSPHYDILDWLEPDWVIDTKQKTFTRGRLWRRPKIELEIRRADGKMWRYFKPHYYLDLHYPVADQDHYDGYGEADYQALLEELTQVQGKFLLSSYRSAPLKGAVAKHGWHSIGIDMPKRTAKGKIKTEVLTANYPISL